MALASLLSNLQSTLDDALQKECLDKYRVLIPELVQKYLAPKEDPSNITLILLSILKSVFSKSAINSSAILEEGKNQVLLFYISTLIQLLPLFHWKSQHSNIVETLIIIFDFVPSVDLNLYFHLFTGCQSILSDLYLLLSSYNECDSSVFIRCFPLASQHIYCKFISCSSIPCCSLHSPLCTHHWNIPDTYNIILELSGIDNQQLLMHGCTLLLGKLMLSMSQFVFKNSSTIFHNLLLYLRCPSIDIQEAVLSTLYDFNQSINFDSHQFLQLLLSIAVLLRDCSNPTPLFEASLCKLINSLFSLESNTAFFHPELYGLLEMISKNLTLFQSPDLKFVLVSAATKLIIPSPILIPLLYPHLSSIELQMPIVELIRNSLSKFPAINTSSELKDQALYSKSAICRVYLHERQNLLEKSEDITVHDNDIAFIEILWPFLHSLINSALESFQKRQLAPLVAAFRIFIPFQEPTLVSALLDTTFTWIQGILLTSITEQSLSELRELFSLIEDSLRELKSFYFAAHTNQLSKIISLPLKHEMVIPLDISLQCLTILSLFSLPNEENIIISLLKHKEELIRAQAFTIFPIILFRSKGLKLSVFDHLHNLDDSPSVLESLALTAGYIACLYSGSTILSSKNKKAPKLICCVCDSDISTNSVPEEIPFHTFQPFLSLLKNTLEDSTIRENMTTSFFRLVAHCKNSDLINNPSLGVFLYELLLDQNQSVRTAANDGLLMLVKACYRGASRSLSPLITHKANESFSKIIQDFITHVETLRFQIDIEEAFESVLESIGTVGCAIAGRAQGLILFSLIGNMMTCDYNLRIVAYDQICRIAKSMNIDTAQLLKTHGELVFPRIMESLQRDPNIVDEVCHSLLGIDCRNFFALSLTSSISFLVANHSYNAMEEIANRLNTSVVNLAKRDIAIILIEILTESVDQNPSETINWLLTTVFSGRTHLFHLLEDGVKRMVPILVFRLGSSSTKNKALELLRWTAYTLKQKDVNNDSVDLKCSVSDLDFSDFCGKHTLRVLNYSSSVLIEKESSTGQKVQCLRSLRAFIPIIASFLSEHSPSLMVLLKHALLQPHIRSEVFFTWNSFIRQLPLRDLGPCLNQIVVYLLPYSNEKGCSDIIKGIWDYIFQNEAILSNFLSEIPFLPRNDNRVLLSLPDRIKQLLNVLTHESSDVRCMVLDELKTIINKSWIEFENQVLESSNSVVLSKLISEVMQRCSDSDIHVREAAAECIGEIGAVDPALITVVTKSDTRTQRDDDQMVIDLLQDYLYPMLRASLPTADHNKVIFSVQELLIHFECSPDTADKHHAYRRNKLKESDLTPSQKRAFTLWERLSADVRQLVTPCLSTGYQFKSSHSFEKGPFYTPRIEFRQWLYRWLRHLIESILNRKDSSKRGRIFRACICVLKANLELAQFILPYVIDDVLRFCDKSNGYDVMREIVTVLESKSDAPQDIECKQCIFDLIDVLSKWLEEFRVAQSSHRSSNSAKTKVSYLSNLLNSINNKLLSEAAYRCGAFTRAFKYFESYLRDVENPFTQENLKFLQVIYAGIDEPDGIAGIAKIRSNTCPDVISFPELTLYHECAGRWTDALTCYEQGLHKDPLNINLHLGILRGFKHLGHLQAVVTHVNGALVSFPEEYQTVLATCGVEAAWRLGDSALLKKFLSICKNNDNFEVLLGRVVLSLLENNDSTLELKAARRKVLDSLSVASKESYLRTYFFFTKLHILNEIEQSISGSTKWSSRYGRTQPSFDTREPILSVHRVIYSHFNLEKEEGSVWLHLAKAACISKQFHFANASILHATELNALSAHFQMAKLLRAQSQNDLALSKLEDAANILAINDDTNKDIGLLKAKISLLLGLWHQEDGTRKSSAIRKYFEQASITSDDNTIKEEAFFQLAKHLDRVFVAELANLDPIYYPKNKLNPVLKTRYQELVVHYIKSLQLGHMFIFESLPRLLTLWFTHHEIPSGHNRGRGKSATELCNFSDLIMPYQWMTVLPQIISRFCHLNEDITCLIAQIITRLFMFYPKQVLWSVTPLTFFGADTKKRKAIAIDKHVRKKVDTATIALLNHANKLISQLILICNTTSSNNSTIPVPASLHNLCPSSAIVPLQSALTVTLSEAAFPSDLVTIVGFPRDMTVLKSKERPCKLGILGSDGKVYVFLCKKEVHGDMRKDSRLIEFNTVVNRLLQKDEESRKRKLRLRTFAVLPLTEQDGIIEWVPKTACFRSLVSQLEQEASIKYSINDVKKALDINTKTDQQLAETFVIILKAIPPVFHKWFLKKFPEPNTWFENRINFAISSAVWSMVGTIVGLGDRHGENILIDVDSGEVVQVDFDCLFDKGLTLRQPETVPFRLTQNMVSAFGITGIEGVFRRTCEIVLTVLRSNRDSLLNVLHAFVHDPLVSWAQNSQQDSIFKRIKLRLDGQNITESLPLSVRGQVDQLIKEATAIENLSRMYIGWRPWS